MTTPGIEVPDTNSVSRSYDPFLCAFLPFERDGWSAERRISKETGVRLNNGSYHSLFMVFATARDLIQLSFGIR